MSRTIPNLVRMFKLKHERNFTKATTMMDVLACLAESRRTPTDGFNLRHINVGMKFRLCGMKRESHA